MVHFVDFWKRKDQVWKLIDAEYAVLSTPNRIHHLTVSMVQSGDSLPCLKSKAAEALHMGPALLAVCRSLNDGSDRDQHRIRALEHIVAFYKILRTGGMFLNEGQAAEVLDHVERFLLHYNWLMQNALADDRGVYPLQLKHHMQWHIAYMARFLNPKMMWCYELEDFMGVLKHIAKNCFAGSSMKIVGRKLLQNYCLVLELTLRNDIKSSVSH